MGSSSMHAAKLGYGSLVYNVSKSSVMLLLSVWATKECSLHATQQTTVKVRQRSIERVASLSSPLKACR